jgi:tetratricopeptide (TPR) repeat protein
MRAFRLQPFIVLALLVVVDAAAKPASVIPNPALAARRDGVDDEEHRRYLPIAEMKIDLRVVGSIARTTLRVHFANATEEWLEGTLSLALPDSATVTGYALNVEDTLIDGVLAEPSRARAAYEARVRQTVDPGLAEVSRSNVFSTRVYPITEEGRTIRLTFVAPVHALEGWALPLVTAERVPRMSLTVRAEGVTTAPELTLPAPLQAQWQQQEGAFVLNASMRNQPLSGELRLKPSSPAWPALATAHPNGRRFFQLNDSIPVESSPRASPERVRLYWDRSLSRKDDALDAEIDLITRYLDATRPRAVDLVLFNSSGVNVRSLATSAEVKARLRSVVYRGATSFAMLQATAVRAADVCLLFSDGINTLDPRTRFEPECETFAVTSASDADTGYLAQVTQRSADAVLRLDRDTADEVLTRLRFRAPSILEVRDASGAPLSFASLPTARGQLAVVGEAPTAGDIVVRIGASESQILERRYPLGPSSLTFEGAGALWAADRITQLAALERGKELRSVSRRFNVASPHMAFVVLEDPSDYVDARIAPPASYPKELREEYAELKADDDQTRRRERDEHLATVVEEWEEQKQWWAEDFDPSAPPRKRGAVRPARGFAFGGGGDELAEVVVTGSLIRRPDAIIELAPWSLERPYIKALDAATAANLEQVLAVQEKAHGELPAFYLDVAEWLHRRGNTVRALEMLLSALEVPARNDETLIVVADRLVRYGRLDRAIWLYEQIVEIAPDRPQPRRALALALAERAKHAGARAAARDLQRAVTLFNEVITSPWGEEYAGIELISLMEVNVLVPRLAALGVHETSLDPRLIAPLDVDLRVVIEWNTPATDLDLWVTEPNGETAMYSNPLTALGGRLSNDMTFGFGPEEYLLRRAPDGRFSVDVDVYAVDQLHPNGASTVTARLIHNFGRADERTEILDIELKPDTDGTVPIGAFVVSQRTASTDRAAHARAAEAAIAARILLQVFAGESRR